MIRAACAIAEQGVTIPSSGPVIRRLPDRVTVDVGVIDAGYEGGVGVWRTARSGAHAERGRHTDLARAASADWLVRGLGHRETLEAGMVFSVTDGAQRDVVAVTTDDPIVLSTRPDPKETLP